MATEPQFHVGDICRIKDLETIKSEGLCIDGDGDIVYESTGGLKFYFWKSDFGYCETQITIKKVHCNGLTCLYRAEEFDNPYGWCGYAEGWIVEDILEPCPPSIDSTNLAEGLSDLFGEVK